MPPNGNGREETLQSYRFGSVDSIDEDRLYVFPDVPSAEQCKRFCDQKSENRNIIVVRDGVVRECYKGLPDEVNNALYETYALHSQQHECPVDCEVQRIVPLKVLRAVRVILSLLSRTAYRSQIKTALKSMNLAERLGVLKTIVFAEMALPPDAAKSIAFQLGQTLALIDDIQTYTKSAIAEVFEPLRPLLYRQPFEQGLLDEFRDQLIEKTRGIYVRQQDDLNLLCYENGPAVREWNAYARQCRGMVLDARSERVVYYPADKFFRVDEIPENAPELLPRDVPVEIVEKVDGSMISCFRYDGETQFHCKGNFNVEQSQKAKQIARRYPIDQLDFDRYWYVFEVIYPKNRFPHGLCVTDYGDREELVLTVLRDRRTNDTVPYSTVVHEARRLGIPHPAVFSGSLDEALRLTNDAQASLEQEGYVARYADGWYVKIKYPAYDTVLKLVNDLRSCRFVKRYVMAKDAGRHQMLAILPPAFREVATAHLDEHRAVCRQIQVYLDRVIADHRSEFPKYVLDHVPKEYQQVLFAYWRGKPHHTDLEKLGLKLHLGEIDAPVGI